MNIEQQIADLEALAAIDVQIVALREQLTQQRSEIDGVRVEIGELDERLGADGASITEMERTRQDLLQELRQIDTQVQRSRDRLGRARNEREQQAAERELDELRKLQRDRDEEVKKVVGLADQARAAVQENETRRGELQARLDGSIDGATASISQLEGQLTDQTAARVAAAEKLPSLVRRRYQAVFDRGKVPVAFTVDGTCQGCFVQLPPMLFHSMLSRTRFEECPFCRRIIYYRPPSEAAPSGDSDGDSSEDGSSEDGSNEQAADAELDASDSGDESSS